MTDHDLATLLRTHVSDEPPFDTGVDMVLGAGRRRVRTSRSVTAVLAVAGVALAGAVGAPLVLGEDGARDPGVDQVIADAVDAYDVTTMPTTMDEHARAVLASSLPDLGPAHFVAFDSQSQKLPERYWPKASGLAVSYGDETPHRVSVTLSHARGEAEGDADRFCSDGLDGGFYLECSVERTPDGDVAITTLNALTLEWPAGKGLQNWRDQFMAVPADDIASTPPDRLWFARTAKVIKSETFVTYVAETVQAPDTATARDLLVVPPEDLAAIGLDPALVMPAPPPGENGCPQWTMPTMDVSCSDAG